MVKLFNINKLEYFWWNWPFDPSDSKWPQINIWANNFCKGYLVDAYAWVTWQYHLIFRRNKHLSENELLTPMTSKDPRFIFDTME